MGTPTNFDLFRRPCPPCKDRVWTATGETRCVNGNVEAKEASNCGSTRWSVQGPVTWTATGETRCRNGNVEAQEANDCGATRWSVQGPVTWTATGETRCRNNLQELQETDDCGNQRWVATTTPCDFCASVRLFCDCTPGFGYHEADIRDPAATVLIADCDGALDNTYIYPTAGPGHTVKITDCDGTLIGYAVNRSDCAPEACTEMKPVFKIVNNVAAPEVDVSVAAPTVNVAAPVVNVAAPNVDVAAPVVNLPAPNVVAASFDQAGELVLTSSDGSTVTAQIPTCE